MQWAIVRGSRSFNSSGLFGADDGGGSRIQRETEKNKGNSEEILDNK